MERGGRTVLSFAEDEQVLRLATDRLAEAVRDGRLGRVTLVRGDGEELLHTTGTALGRALAAAGFAPTPRGLRLRGVR